MTNIFFKQNIFFSVITKNSNWEILTKNLDKLGLTMKNLNIFWGSLKNQIFRGEVYHKTNIKGRIA